MSEGKFSQPRPHRDEERQIEESFRQLTEDKKRHRKKVYTPEEDIPKTLPEISPQEVPLPDEFDLPFEHSARLEQTVPFSPKQYPPQRPAAQPQRSKAAPQYDLIPEDLDSFFEESAAPAAPEPEEEPDFIDKLMQFGDFFEKHQTPVILGLCGAAVLLILLFVSIFFLGGRNDDKAALAGNVYIAGVNINGMTKDQAVDAVSEVTNTSYRSTDMVIDFGTAQLTLSPKDTGARLDVEAAVEAAFALEASREDQYVALLPYLQLNTDYIYDTLKAYAEDTGSTLTQTSYGLEGDEPELSADKFNEQAPTQTLVIIMGTPGIGFDVEDVYDRVLDAYSLHVFFLAAGVHVDSVNEPDPIDLEAIYEEFYIEPVNASMDLQNYQTIPGSYGYGFDLEEAQKLVDKAQHGEVLRIPMEYIAPEILDNDAFFQDTLGQHQTRGTNHDDRNRNLQLACDALDGTVLNPGESLSFSSILNKVGSFREAPEDAGLEEVEAGGVSQVASTLYYAALLSDLNISSRSNHSYLPSFIDYGLDATKNLKLSNSTGYPIQINAQYSGGYVKVEILGTEERDYYVMLESSISSSTAAKTVYEDYPYDNDEGYEDGDVIEEGSAGYLVKSYKVKYNRSTGRELSRDFLANSQYPAVDRVVARVEEPPETEPETEPPTEAPTERPTRPTVPPTEEPTPPPTEATVPPTEATLPPPETAQATEPYVEEPVWETEPESYMDPDFLENPEPEDE